MTTINWPTVSVISSGSQGISSLSSSGGESIVAGNSSTEGFLRGLEAGPYITLSSGSNTIAISGSEGVPPGTQGDVMMYGTGSGWQGASYLNKYVVGPDPTDRYSEVGAAIAAVVADGSNVSSINPAIIIVKPKLGTSNTYNIGNIVMPPNISIQGLSYGSLAGMPGARLNGTITFASASSFNTLKDLSIRTSIGDVINVTDKATVHLNSCDIRAEGTRIPVKMSAAGSTVNIVNGTTIQAIGSAVAVQNEGGTFNAYAGTLIQAGSNIIAYNSTVPFTDAYASFNSALIAGEIHFTTNGGAEIFNCRQILSDNSAYPVEFDNAGVGGLAGGVVYKNSSIQYSSGLSGPSGPWINVSAGEASIYVGNVVLDENSIRTLNPYTDNVDMNIGEVDAENSAAWIRRSFIEDADPSDRQIMRFYDNGSSQDQVRWQDEEPVSVEFATSIAISDTDTTRHLLCTNANARSVSLPNANVRPGAITIIDGAGTAAIAPIGITGSGGQTIRGGRELLTPYGAATYVSDGTSVWYRVSENPVTASFPNNPHLNQTFAKQGFSSGALGSVSFATEGAYWLNAKVSGMEASTPTSSGSCAFFISALATTDGGTTSIGPAGISNDFTDNSINCNASFELSGNDMQLMVSGSGTYNWAATMEYQRA